MQINDMSHDHPQKCNIIGNIGRTMNLEPSVEPKPELEVKLKYTLATEKWAQWVMYVYYHK